MQIDPPPFNVPGALDPSSRELTSGDSYDMTAEDRTLIVRKVGGSPTAVKLPPKLSPGVRVKVIDGKGDAATNPITVSGDAINDGDTVTIDTNYGWASFIRSTDKWIIEG